MSEPRLISPLLDDYMIGGAVSEHHGVRCYPAMKKGTEDKYIVKVISLPASETQLNAMLLTGAYKNEADALVYYKQLADDTAREAEILRTLSEQEGFVSYLGAQVEQTPDGKGYEVYLLSEYRRTLQKSFKRESLTHLDALNLGLDLCAALSVCRRSGYLYVDLKPENVFVTEQRQYRIGGLGFFSISGLKFASLPEKYISAYTPPEITDASATLNTTMDIYAAGLILYQAYNNGQLPFNADVKPGDAIPAPMYADYEMSEIILKACALAPEDRWEDPSKMGQAIVSYMQRNGAMDTPIVPSPAQAEEQLPVEDTDPAEPAPSLTDNCQSDAPQPAPSEAPSELEFTEPDAFLSEAEDEDLLPEELEDYETVTDEVSEILTQADELAALDVPEPVVVPEHVDVPVPEPITPEMLKILEEDIPLPTEEYAIEDIYIPELDEKTRKSLTKKTPKLKMRWLLPVVAALVLLGLVAGGWLFYRNYYLLPIDSLRVEGNEEYLTVYVTTEADESLLQILCIDQHGNQIPAVLKDGKAVFSGLMPNSSYKIKLVASGFHKLVGNTAADYSTPAQTNILRFEAATGYTDGSAILSFSVDGPNCDVWAVNYVADGEEVRNATFDGNTVTLTDLTVGKDYTFTLVPGKDLYLTGQEQITFTARKIVKAENIQIADFTDNALTITWNAPDSADVASWTVRCYNESYNETITAAECSATFTNLDHTAAYAVEITANGMRVSSVKNIPANIVTASNLKADSSVPLKLSLTWDTSLPVPAEGWTLCYSIAGTDAVRKIPCSENSATIDPAIPNTTYKIWLEDASGNLLLHSETEVHTGEPRDYAQQFAGLTVKRSDLEFVMCITPAKKDWLVDDVKEEDKTNSFTAGQNASFIIYLQIDSEIESSQTVDILYVFRTEDGTPIHTERESYPWEEIWYKNCCKRDIPDFPSTPGNYVVEVYFNGGLAVSQPFTVT